MMNFIRKRIRNLLNSQASKASIVINGVNVTGNIVGGNLSISNGVVRVDGKVVQDLKGTHGPIEITVEGSVELIHLDNGIINVNGDVGEAETTNGDIDVVGSVGGNCETTNGDIKANEIHGSCRSVNGDIKGRK